MGVDEQILQMTLEQLQELGCLAAPDRLALEAWHPTGQPMPPRLQVVLVEAMAQARHRLEARPLH